MRPFTLTFISIAGISVSAYAVTGSAVNCHAGPGTSFAVEKSYSQSEDVNIVCQTDGNSFNGSSVWDKTSGGCYVADYYVKTGSNGYIMSKCGGGSCAAPDSNKETVDLIAEFEGFVPTICERSKQDRVLLDSS